VIVQRFQAIAQQIWNDSPAILQQFRSAYAARLRDDYTAITK
jgi:hypothetical protein